MCMHRHVLQGMGETHDHTEGGACQKVEHRDEYPEAGHAAATGGNIVRHLIFLVVLVMKVRCVGIRATRPAASTASNPAPRGKAAVRGCRGRGNRRGCSS